MKRHFHFFYVRGDNAGVRTVRVHRALAIGAIVACVSLVAIAVILTVTNAGKIASGVANERLKSENKRLSAELDRFRAEIAELREKMDLSFELQNRARLIASLDPVSDDVWQVGIGGPEPSLALSETPYPESAFMAVDESLDRMVRQSELQLKSYEEIIAILEKERDVRNSTPTIRPVRGGFLSSRYGRRMDPFLGQIVHHTGIDYRARAGTPVMSTADGVVSRAGRNGGFGIMIEINHSNGFKTRYAHLSKALVTRGQKVKRGEIIGAVGDTGHSTGNHLHYEVLFRMAHRDPLQYVIPEGVSYD